MKALRAILFYVRIALIALIADGVFCGLTLDPIFLAHSLIAFVVLLGVNQLINEVQKVK